MESDLEKPPVRGRKWTRDRLALFFIIGFFILILYPLLYIGMGLMTTGEVLDLQKSISSVMGPFAGSIVGYYYGKRTRASS